MCLKAIISLAFHFDSKINLVVCNEYYLLHELAKSHYSSTPKALYTAVTYSPSLPFAIILCDI